jgi:hypothetical protein
MPRRTLEELRQLGIDDREVEQVPYPPLESLPPDERSRLEEEIRALEDAEAETSKPSR